MDDAGRLLAGIAAAWASALPRIPFEPDTDWKDCGLDSLRSLQLVLLLEEQLGCRIPLDLLTPETTPRGLAQALATPAKPRRADGRPVIMLVPGLLGDEPALADFRRALGDAARFELLDVPDIETPAAVLSDARATAHLLAEQVMARQPEGPLILAGYSMGGMFAFEMAQQLRTQGREIALLVLLDPFLVIDPRRPFEAGTAPLTPTWLRLASASNLRMRPAALIERLKFAALLLSGALDDARQHLFAQRVRLSPATMHWRRRRLLGRLRWQALRRWQPVPWEGRVLLAISREAAKHYDIARWDHLAPHARRIAVPTTHLDLFGDEGLALLRPAIVEALAES